MPTRKYVVRLVVPENDHSLKTPIGAHSQRCLRNGLCPTCGKPAALRNSPQRRNFFVLLSSDSQRAEDSSSEGFWKSKLTDAPTRFRVQGRVKHRRRRTDCHRRQRIAIRAAVPRVSLPRARSPEGPASARPPGLSGPKLERASARSACKSRTVHRKTASHAHAGLCHPCIHSPAKSCSPTFSRPASLQLPLWVENCSVVTPPFSYRPAA